MRAFLLLKIYVIFTYLYYELILLMLLEKYDEEDEYRYNNYEMNNYFYILQDKDKIDFKNFS